MDRSAVHRAVALTTPGALALMEEIRISLLAATLTLRCVEVGVVDPRRAALVADDCDQTLRELGRLLGG